MARNALSVSETPPLWTIRFSGEFVPAEDAYEAGEITIQGSGPTNFQAVVNDELVLAIQSLIGAQAGVLSVVNMVDEHTRTVATVVPEEAES